MFQKTAGIPLSQDGLFLVIPPSGSQDIVDLDWLNLNFTAIQACILRGQAAGLP